jgi:putative Ca2+/H+ antiporter (TMEM165/GDT1 family)
VKVEFAPPTKIAGLSEEFATLENQAQTDRYQSVATLEKPEAVADTSKTTPQKQAKKSSVTIFGSTFLTIFLAEFGDKTQLSTLLMSAESQSPCLVFLGAGAALLTTSLLGVLLGQWLATRLSPKTIEKAAGVSLLLVSVTLLWDVLQF